MSDEVTVDLETGEIVASALPAAYDASAAVPMILPNAEGLVASIDDAHRRVSALMRSGVDYMAISGRKVLMKSGAERILMAFGCRVIHEIITEQVELDRVNRYDAGRWEDAQKPDDLTVAAKKADHTGRFRKNDNGAWVWQERHSEIGESTGLYRYVVRAEVISNKTGQKYGEGLGACSSLEKKYVRDPHDAEHTILQMATKRATLAAIKTVFGLTGLFEVEDEEVSGGGDRGSGIGDRGSHSADDRGKGGKTILGWAVFCRELKVDEDDKKALMELCSGAKLKYVDLCNQYQRELPDGRAMSWADFEEFAGRVAGERAGS